MMKTVSRQPVRYHEMPEDFRQVLISELKAQDQYTSCDKDIIIVVRNQHDHVKRCLESVAEHTKDYRLFVWDNGSDAETKSLLVNYAPSVLCRSETNTGFVVPNNYLAQLTMSPYIILLNSDTIVSPGWDEAMIGILQSRPKTGLVGYQGRLLNESGFGDRSNSGNNIDYVEGWCMCLPRSIYAEIGLFDTNFKFAYCEDSDLCLRIKKAGYKLYALHLNYVKHIGGATSKAVNNEMAEFTHFFSTNHVYLKEKWSDYLKNERVLG